MIPQRVLRNDTARVIDAVAEGESFVVTRNGVPEGEVRPFPGPRRTLVPRRELVGLAAAGPRVDAAGFRSDLDDLLDQSLS